jgi:hypothetical protein
VLRYVGIGTHQEHAVVGLVGVCGPDLLTVQHPLIAFARRACAQRGQVGAGVGFGEPETPHLVGAQQSRQIALFLFRSAEDQQRRAEDTDRRAIDEWRCGKAHHFLVHRQMLQQRRVAAAVGTWEVHGDPPPIVQAMLPFLQKLDALAHRPVIVQLLPALQIRQVALQPRPELGTCLFNLRRKREVHKASQACWRGRNCGKVTSSVMCSYTTSTGMPTCITSGVPSTIFVVTRTPSSRSMSATM